MTIVSNNIKYLRRLNGLTQEQFSGRIGIKRSLLGAYEEGRANPNLDNLQNIAKIFGTSVDALIKTDIRKIRETPPMNYLSNSNNGEVRNQDPPPISNVIDKYFSDSGIVPASEIHETKPYIEEQTSLINEYKKDLYPTENQEVTVKKEQRDKEYLGLSEGIPFINKFEIGNYISKKSLNPYLTSLPKVSIPKLNSSHARAFVADQDFPNEGDIIIGEIVGKHQSITDGKHHILITTDGKVLFRRVFDLSRIKGCYLLSSDNQEISSSEIPVNQVVELLEFKAHISYTLPKVSNINPKIKNLIDELYLEIGKS